MGVFKDITGIDSGIDSRDWGVGNISLDPGGFVDDIGQGIEDFTDDIEGFTDDIEKALGLSFEIPEFTMPPTPEGVLITKSGNISPLPVIYGTRRVGGHRVFVTTTGDKNQYLHMVYALGEGEISSIGSVWINDIEVASGDLDAGGNATSGDFTGLLRIKKCTGADAQTADADLVAEVTEWTTNHRLRGVAYVYLRCKWDQDNRAFGSVPKVQVDVTGRKLYDPRTTLTTFSSNPALVVYDYLTNVRYGRGLSVADLDVQSFEDAADYCDAQVTPYSGAPGTHARYSCDGLVNTGRKVLDNTRDLLTSCRGWLPYVAGQWRLVLDKPETAVFTFDTSNMIGALSFSRAGRGSRLNRVQASYTNPAEDYAGDLVTIDAPAFRVSDNNLLLEKRISLGYTISPYRASALAELQLKQSRQGLVVGFRATAAALVVAVGEVVNVTHATPGWINKTFRVAALDLLADATVAVKLTEYESTVYDLSLPTEAPTPPDTNLPNPNVVAAPAGLLLFSGNDELLLTAGGVILSRIRVVWTPPADAYVSEYDVEYKQSADANWIPAANPKGQASAETYIGPVVDGVDYDVRIRARNTNDAVSAWVTGLNHTVAGKTELPPTVSTFSFVELANKVRRFGWTLTTPPADLDGYQIRYGLGSGLAWAAMADLHTGVLRASPYETSQLAAGDYTFGIKAIDGSGNESGSALTLDATLGAPPALGALAGLDGVDYTDVTGTKPPANADVTGDQVAVGTGMLYNWDLNVSDSESKPAGIRGTSIPFRTGVDFGDATNSYIRLSHATEDQLAYGFPAAAIDDQQKYSVTIRHRSSATTASGLYLRMEESATVLQQGKTHIGLGGEAVTQARSSVVDLVGNGPMPDTAWIESTYIYTPTPGVKFATFAMYKKNTGVSHYYEVDSVQVSPVAKTADEIAEGASRKWAGQSGADVTGDKISATQQILPNWDFSMADSEGKPAGIRGVQDIADRTQLQLGGIGIQILSAPDTSVAYGFPAIAIDDKALYEITIIHKSSAASATGLYLRMNELATALPAGKTHVGGAAFGFEAVATPKTSSVDLSIPAGGPMPGTTEVQETYTYTPTTGTKFASFSMYNWGAVTAGVIYEVRSVQVIKKVRAAIGADVTVTAIEAGATITQGGVTLSSGGAIKSAGKVVGVGKGVFLGYNAGEYELDVGDHDTEKFIHFDGDDLVIGRDTKIRGADAYVSDAFYYSTHFDSIDGWIQQIVSDATIGHSTIGGIYMRTTAAAGGYAVLYRYFRWVSNDIPWTKARRIKFNVTYEVVGDSTAKMLNGRSTTGARYIGFRSSWDGVSSLKLFGICSGDASETSVDLGVSFSVMSSFELEAVFDPGVDVKFYVDKVLKGTLTTNLPSGTQAEAGRIDFSVLDTGGSQTLGINDVKFWVEP